MSNDAQVINPRFDAQTVKNAARGRWATDIFPSVGIPAESLSGEHGPCPKCPDKGDNKNKDRFCLKDPDVGWLYCNQCFNKKNSDGLAAVQWFRECSFPESLRIVAEIVGVDPVGRSNGHKVKQGPTQKPKQEQQAESSRETSRATADVELLDRTYSALITESWYLSPQHRANLKQRGFDENQLQQSGYRSLDSKTANKLAGSLHQKFGDDLFSVPGFYKDKYGKPKLCFPGIKTDADKWEPVSPVLLIPVRDISERITAVKIRVDDPTWLTTNSKYVYLSAKGKTGISARADVHIPKGTPPNPVLVRITEGELKADAASLLSGIPTLSIPGVNSWKKAIPVLQSMQCRSVWIAMDADCQTNPNVAEAIKGLFDAMHTLGIGVSIETWDPSDGKGIDDLLAAGKNPTVLTGDPATQFVDEIWQSSGAKEIEQKRQERKNVNHEHVRQSVGTPQIKSTVPILEPGTLVKCLDRDNVGKVIRDDGTDLVYVHFVSQDGNTADTHIQRTDLQYPDGRSVIPSSFSLDLISSKDFANASYKLRYLVRHVLVEGQPCIVGGPRKGLKTGTMIDLAVSLGTATPFLGKPEFSVPERVNVAILSGESGLYTLQETAKRVSLAHNVNLEDATIWWADKLPSIANPDHLSVLRDEIDKHKIKVCVIDPAYLCLLSGDTQGRQASNLFDVGAILLGLVNVGRDTGCGIVLAHHTRKNPTMPFAIPELEELAYAGFAEFARQWILLNRRSVYRGGGSHELWLAIGGSAGHSSTWAYDVEEGIPDEWFRGRFWDVKVKPADNAIQAAKDDRERQKENDQHNRKMKNVERILTYLRECDQPKTATNIRDTISINAKTFAPAWDYIVNKKLVVMTPTKGANKRLYDAFSIATGPTGLFKDSPAVPLEGDSNGTGDYIRVPVPLLSSCGVGGNSSSENGVLDFEQSR